MRLSKERIDSISQMLVKNLIEEGFIIYVEKRSEKLQEKISRVITDELIIEDKLNEEVRDIMRAHTEEINKDGVDYSRMFQMIKKKLVKEKGIII